MFHYYANALRNLNQKKEKIYQNDWTIAFYVIVQEPRVYPLPN